VPKKKPAETQLPPEVVEHWPEVFKDLDIQVVPLEYLHSVRVFFEDGKVWEIDIEKSRQKSEEEGLEDTLEQLFEEYEDVITNIDFRLDTKRLKKDVQERTSLFLKKRK
jgi:hypothetical protein